MKKFILSILLLIIVTVSGGLFYVYSNLDDLLKNAIETYGSQATQTDVRVEQINMKLTEGSAGIVGLSIANPDGYSMPLAFSLGETRLGIDLQSLQKEPYVVNEVVVVAPEIFVEINKDNKINLNEIKNNLMSLIPSSNEVNETTVDDTKAAEPKLIVRKIIFTDGVLKAKIAALNNKTYKLKFPSIDMNELGGTEGLTPTELTSEIITRLSNEAVAMVKKKVIDEKLEKLKAEAKAKLEAKKAEVQAKIDAKKAQTKAILDRKKAEAKAKLEEKKARLGVLNNVDKEKLRNKLKDKLNKYRR